MKWLLVSLCVTSTVVGDVFRSLGMRHHGEIHDFRPGAIGGALSAIARNWMVILSTCAMAVSFIPETLLARFLLKEAVDTQRWLGIGLILVGVVFISQ